MDGEYTTLGLEIAVPGKIRFDVQYDRKEDRYHHYRLQTDSQWAKINWNYQIQEICPTICRF